MGGRRVHGWVYSTKWPRSMRQSGPPSTLRVSTLLSHPFPSLPPTRWDPLPLAHLGCCIVGTPAAGLKKVAVLHCIERRRRER